MRPPFNCPVGRCCAGAQIREGGGGAEPKGMRQIQILRWTGSTPPPLSEARAPAQQRPAGLLLTFAQESHQQIFAALNPYELHSLRESLTAQLMSRISSASPSFNPIRDSKSCSSCCKPNRQKWTKDPHSGSRSLRHCSSRRATLEVAECPPAKPGDQGICRSLCARPREQSQFAVDSSSPFQFHIFATSDRAVEQSR